MIDLKDIRDRVQNLDIFLSVEDTISAAEAMETFNAPPPAAFVSTSAERARPNELATGHRQRVDQTVSVLWALGAERAHRDGDPMEEVKGKLLTSLVAWQPKGSAKPLEYVSYGVRFIGEGLIWGEILLVGAYHITG